MSTFLRIFTFIFMLSSYVFSYAGIWEEEITLEKSWSENLELSWEWDENVFMYRIDYWTSSIADSDYQETTDVFEWNTFEIKWLELETEYYLTVYGYDPDANVVYQSKESVFRTWNVEILYVTSSELLSSNVLELTFSNPLDIQSGEENEFTIYEKNNSSELFTVNSTVINSEDNSKIKLYTDESFENGVEYEVVVLYIKDKFGQNIEFWVDSTSVFFWKSFEEEVIDNNTEIEKEDNLVENTQVDEIDNIEENETDNIWVELNSADIAKDVVWASSETTELPTTWPEHVLLLIITIILSSLIFVFRYKNS